MRRRPWEATDDDSGFTLIELLVVMVIIGILAGIAIPVFLNQRGNAHDTAAKSDLRTVAAHEEGYYSANQNYGTFAQMDPGGSVIRMSPGVTVTIVFLAPNGYCLRGQYPGRPSYYYDNQGGGLQPPTASGCPVTNAGAAGDSRTG